MVCVREKKKGTQTPKNCQHWTWKESGVRLKYECKPDHHLDGCRMAISTCTSSGSRASPPRLLAFEREPGHSGSNARGLTANEIATWQSRRLPNSDLLPESIPDKRQSKSSPSLMRRLTGAARLGSTVMTPVTRLQQWPWPLALCSSWRMPPPSTETSSVLKYDYWYHLQLVIAVSTFVLLTGKVAQAHCRKFEKAVIL